MVYQEKFGLLFTCGEDGTVRAWDPQTKGLVFLLQVSHLPVKLIALSPVSPQVAVVESDGFQIFRLSVWDWQQRKRLYTVNLTETPLFLSYSSLGNYLLYGKTDWNGMVFLNAQNGSPLSFFTEGSGIVSSVFISGTENTILSYSPSGSLKYWDLRNGTKRAEFPTLSNISSLSFTANGRFMVGMSGNRLNIIDLVSGRTAASREIPNLQSVSIDPNNSLILTLAGGRVPALNLWSYSDGTIQPEEGPIKHPGGNIKTILLTGSRAYSASDSGIIYSQLFSEPEPTVFSQNKILEIDDIAAGESSLILTAKNAVINCTSDFFTSPSADKLPDYFHATVETNPFNTPLSIKHVEGNSFLVWQKNQPLGQVSLFYPELNQYNYLWDYSSEITEIKVFNNTLLSLSRAGSVEIRSLENLIPSFTYSYPGIRDITFSGKALVASGSSAALLSTPLLYINPDTLETVPILETNMLTYKVLFDPANSTLFSIGFEKRQDSLITVLKSHTGTTFDRSRTRITYSGEDHTADFVVDPATGTLFTSLGYSGVRMLSWSGFTSLESTDHIPRQLAIQGTWLYSLNNDYSISVWNNRTGKWIMDFYIFQDLEWVALFANGDFYTSPNGESYISVFNEEGLYSEEVQKIRTRSRF